MAKLGAMRTLAQIIAYVREVMPALAAAPKVNGAHAAPKATNGAPTSNGSSGSNGSNGSNVDLEKVMLEVVAAKTGYPVEMLGADMDLESDLGVDSIDAWRNPRRDARAHPNLPELDIGQARRPAHPRANRRPHARGDGRRGRGRSIIRQG